MVIKKLPDIRLAAINGKIVNLSIFIRISPGNPIRLIVLKDGLVERTAKPKNAPINTLQIVKINKRLFRRNCAFFLDMTLRYKNLKK